MMPRNKPTPRGPGRPRKPLDTSTPAGRLAARIKAARERAGLTVEQAAAACGVDDSTWWRYEAADLAPNITTLSSIARAIGADVTELVS